MASSSEGGNLALLATIAISVVFFAAATVALGYYLVFGENLAGPPQNIYVIRLSEYTMEASPEPIIVKVGQPVVFKIVNEGAVEHEMMFVPDLKMMAEMMMNMAVKLREQNPELSEEEIIAMIEERHEELMHEMIDKALEGKVEGDEFMIELKPGESAVATYTFLKPGIYVIACMKLEGTFPEVHAQEGMFNQIIVVEG